MNRSPPPTLAILYCNAAWATRYGLEPAEALGPPLDDSSPTPAGRPAPELALLGPDNPLIVDAVARQLPNAPGQWLEWADLSRWPRRAGVLSVGRDVTGRRNAELNWRRARPASAKLADNPPTWCGASSPARSPHFDYISPSVEHPRLPAIALPRRLRPVLDILDEDGRIDVGSIAGPHTAGHDFHLDTPTAPSDRRGADHAIRNGLQGVSRDVTASPIAGLHGGDDAARPTDRIGEPTTASASSSRAP